MKIFTAEQIRSIDAQTIAQEPIKSIDLMERAALAFVQGLEEKFPAKERPICIFCGSGNNGGDGFAVARLMQQRFYQVTVFACSIGHSLSPDAHENFIRLPIMQGLNIHPIQKGDVHPAIPAGSVVIDALFGSGLNLPLSAYWVELIEYLNQLPVKRVAIDIPSGLFADTPTLSSAFKAHHTLSFEFPKRAFFFPENQAYVGDWELLSIGLSPAAIAGTKTPYYFVDQALIVALLHKRNRHDHKGTYGHALLIMGSYGKMGAAILAARACLRSGTGLVSVHVPKCGYEIMQISLPEAMVSIDRHQYYLSEIPALSSYKAIGIGCGMEQRKTTADALKTLLENVTVPLLLDADALNLLSKNPDWYELVPKGSVLTPHPKEFERLFGKTQNSFERNDLLRQKAVQYGWYILLKGAYSCLATPAGECYFNGSGNPGMATAGSGDVLSGVITGLLAQGYAAKEAALVGMYIHGRAGDLAAQALGHEALIASDIIANLGEAFQELY